MLPEYKKILVTTDLTHNSSVALKHAVMLSRPSKADIHLLHVIPDVDGSVRAYVTSLMGEGNLEQFETKHEESARKSMQKTLEDFAHEEFKDYPDDLKRVVGIEVAHGQPVTQILKASDQLNVDLIVMASHGKGPIEHTFLGSVTEKVLRSSKRPVYVIPLSD